MYARHRNLRVALFCVFIVHFCCLLRSRIFSLGFILIIFVFNEEKTHTLFALNWFST